MSVLDDSCAIVLQNWCDTRGETAVHWPFCPLTLSSSSLTCLQSPLLPVPRPSFPTFCPHSVKHCKRFELCKGLFLTSYFVHNVKPESVYFGKKCFVSEIIASLKQKKKRNYKKQTFTINNMKCSAVRKDFWCLTNKVNQIIRNFSCSSVTLSNMSLYKSLIWQTAGG